MKKTSLALTLAAVSIASANAALIIQTEVVESTTSTHTLEFTFTGTLDTPPAPAGGFESFLFIYFDGNVNLENSLIDQDINTFATNTVTKTSGGTLNTFEVREGGGSGAFSNRFGTILSSNVVNSDTFSGVARFDVATTSSIVNADLDGLAVHWGFDAGFADRGTLIGTTAAVPEPSSSALIGLGGLALILRRRR